MTPPIFPIRRGMTLLELMLALSITTLIAGAIAAMLAAVATGVGTRTDNRSAMIRAHAAQSRITAYITPGRCVLATDGPDLALWLNDRRESDTVHVSEVRWLLFDSASGTIDVHFVKFPDGWTEVAEALADTEYPAASDWFSIRDSYDGNGWISQLTLVDGLSSVSVETDETNAVDSRVVTYDLNFQADDIPIPARASASIRLHEPPLS